ncbi:hypothetical protein DFH27DRAFT_603770 [Peziza echinospora]|nr:hypothetical protein DFH27DRAFT_603770 [Peziza echinospora]
MMAPHRAPPPGCGLRPGAALLCCPPSSTAAVGDLDMCCAGRGRAGTALAGAAACCTAVRLRRLRCSAPLLLLLLLLQRTCGHASRCGGLCHPPHHTAPALARPRPPIDLAAAAAASGRAPPRPPPPPPRPRPPALPPRPTAQPSQPPPPAPPLAHLACLSSGTICPWYLSQWPSNGIRRRDPRQSNAAAAVGCPDPIQPTRRPVNPHAGRQAGRVGSRRAINLSNRHGGERRGRGGAADEASFISSHPRERWLSSYGCDQHQELELVPEDEGAANITFRFSSSTTTSSGVPLRSTGLALRMHVCPLQTFCHARALCSHSARRPPRDLPSARCCRRIAPASACLLLSSPLSLEQRSPSLAMGSVIEKSRRRGEAGRPAEADRQEAGTQRAGAAGPGFCHTLSFLFLFTRHPRQGPALVSTLPRSVKTLHPGSPWP